MKAITLTQPYATLVALLFKGMETRSWATNYRGPLAIHAGKGLGPVGGREGLHQIVRNRPFCDVLFTPLGCTDSLQVCEVLPFGAIVATCELIDCVPTTYVRSVKIVRRAGHEWLWTASEKAFGDYADGRWAWLLANVRPLPEPIPAKGALGLWEWDDAVIQNPKS